MQKRKTKNKPYNPFVDYQKKRQEESANKVQAAIATIEQVKGNVSYNAVAKLAKMTATGLKRNKECSMLIEQAKARQKGSKLPPGDVINAIPRTIDDAISVIRMQRVDIRELRHKLSIYERMMKKYKIVNTNGEVVIERVVEKSESAYDALQRVLNAIFADGVYKLTSDGIIDPYCKVIVNNQLVNLAGLVWVSEEKPF